MKYRSVSSELFSPQASEIDHQKDILEPHSVWIYYVKYYLTSSLYFDQMWSMLAREILTSNILWSLQIVGNNFRWRINDFWCSAPEQYNITKLLYYYSNLQQQEPNFKFQKKYDNQIDQGRYLLIQICKICYGCVDSLLGNISATCGHSGDFVHFHFSLLQWWRSRT